MTIQATSVNLPDSAGDTITGTTTDAYVAALTWTCWGFSNKTLIIENTGDTNSLTWKLVLQSYPDGSEHDFEYDGETEFDVAAAGVDLTILSYAYARAILYVKSTVASSETTYELDYNGNLGTASNTVTVRSDDTTVPQFGTAGSGTLNDSNTSTEITTTASGALCWIGVSLSALADGDDFELELDRYTGSEWRLYKKYAITVTGTDISIDTGGGAVVQYLDELNWESIYLDSTRKLRIKTTRNSATDRNFGYWYNKQEVTA